MVLPTGEFVPTAVNPDKPNSKNSQNTSGGKDTQVKVFFCLFSGNVLQCPLNLMRCLDMTNIGKQDCQ